MMKIDKTEKYADIFERLLNLFPVVESALEDEVESEEFKEFMDLKSVYNHAEDVKEYEDSIPVEKSLLVKQTTAAKY